MTTNTPMEIIEDSVAALTPEERMQLFNSLRQVYNLALNELTEGSVDGNGVLDVITLAIRVQLKALVKELGMSNNQSALILGESLGGIVNAAVQFALTKDTAAADAITAVTRSQVAVQELEIARTNTEIAKAKLAQESLQENILQAQVLDKIFVPKFKETSEGSEEFIRALDTNNNQIFTEQKVEGQIGAQKDLLAEQVQAYKQRAANDYASLFVEAFAVQYSSNPSATASQLVSQFDSEKVRIALEGAKAALTPTS